MLRKNGLRSALSSAITMAIAIWCGTIHANQFVEMKEARFPTQKDYATGTFSLQGAGILKWGIWFDVYAAAYYQDQVNPQNQRLMIHYFVPVKAQQIKSAAEKHLLKQHGERFYHRIKTALNDLHGAMRDVTAGDSYTLNLYQDRELVLELNGQVIYHQSDPELGKTYLNLWLGKNPLDENLKLSLLGQTYDP